MEAQVKVDRKNNVSYMNQIEKLIDDRKKCEYDLREIKNELNDLALNFKGSLQEALDLGLVKFTFPVHNMKK